MQARVPLALAVALICLATATAASAKPHVFSVDYTGHGHLTSDVKGHTQNDNGRCENDRKEDSKFSWGADWKMSISFGQKGSSAVNERTNPVSLFTDPSQVEESGQGPGCATDSGDSIGGTAKCTGHTAAAGVEQLLYPSLGRGKRGKMTIFGPTFAGAAFGGSWTYASGSCAQALNGSPLLIPESLALPFDIGIRVPIKEATVRTLPKGHFFKVDVKEGHYARNIDEAARCKDNDDGCSMNMTWSGRLKIRRLR